MTAALRTDQNSAFGTDFQSVVYPKASVSWLLSEEPWYRAPDWSDNLRLRAAFGASGVQPGPNDALRSYAAQQTNVNGMDQPGLVYNAIGNTELKPERSKIETGFEAGFLAGRYNVDLTYYNKKTKDALISAIVAPSVGAATSVQPEISGPRRTAGSSSCSAASSWTVSGGAWT